MKAYPHFSKRRTVELDGLWDFSFLGDDINLDLIDVSRIAYNSRMPVPSAFDAFPAYAGKRGTAAYRTRVDITAGKRGVVQFQSVGMYCQVYVDGKLARTHHPAYVPFTCDIPSDPCQKSREIVVIVDNRYDPMRAPLQEKFFDFYNYGGIMRGVTAFELPECHIEHCHVTPGDITRGAVSVRVTFGGKTPPRVNLSATIDGVHRVEFPGSPIVNGAVRLAVTIPNPTLWSPESPALHTMTLETEDDDMIVRFGLREVKAEKGRILLNGKPVKLLGVCRHEAHPQFGPALPDQQLVADIQILKDLGCNFVRGAHYPQDQRFLDLCDEAGILFFEEALGWGQNKSHFTTPRFVEAQLAQTRAMVTTSFNHPCVIMWGFLNEGESDVEEARTCYESLIRLIRELDPSRLVTYASFKRRTDLFLAQVDVVCYNTYPGWYNAEDDENPLAQILPKIRSDVAFLRSRQDLKDKPFILSEIGGAAIYGWHDAMNGFWTEEYQAELLESVCREVVGNDDISGVSIWQFFDCRTFKCGRALRRARAFNNKGILDEYRRPKQAYHSVKRIFTGQDRKGA